MPDMGFTEILFIAVIAIIVLGPDKLPEAMVQIGRFVGKIKKMWRDATADIRKELELEEMKEEMQKYKKQLEELQKKVDTDVGEINSGLTSLDDLTAMGKKKDFSDMIK
ncbi:twin arginine-targeting protein translocase TatB [Nautilia profundicola AmH]|uniref:Sec-independent protein translocase protein TatB homolog n=1 Tax=Nautilia profundicola (strain ATCC BAA-1463 / DSM 18972 / AmH) TaxID=598659 RepID=B9L6Z4_NAUPA|nr:Sec-independent protein translocase protein TatB [Nautilia profundicola]ACM93068.1 twin arginine-targeting protein translocase TatB [Nautilia profundicola AmH]